MRILRVLDLPTTNMEAHAAGIETLRRYI